MKQPSVRKQGVVEALGLVQDRAPAYAGRVNFVGVAGLGPTEDMREFVVDSGDGGFPHLDDADGTIWIS